MRKLFLFIVFAVLSIGARADFSGSGSGTASDPYVIVNPNQLNELRNFLNNANVYFKLEDDIDLQQWIKSNNPTQGWQPVGVSASPFKGHFDGNGKTIKSFMINRTSSYVGLFGYLVGAEIKNLAIEGTVKGGENTGGYAGYCDGSSKISNVHYTGNVTGGNNTGGLVGTSKSSTFTNVWVKGNVTGNNIVGGILGYSEYSNCNSISYEGDIIGNDEVGGICGRNFAESSINSSYTSCYSKGSIHANNYVGGIVGIFPYRTRFDITSCGAFIDITANSYVGGLCGKINSDQYNFSFKASSTINKCYVIGSITCSGDYVGGLIGYTKGFEIYPDRYSESLTNSYFNGSVLGRDNVGGLIGWTYGIQISRNYSVAAVNGNLNVGGLVGHVDNGVTKIKSCAALNTSVNAVVKNVGRVYGSQNGDINIGATIGTADENRALLSTKVSANGIAIECNDDMQNGTSFGNETFKLRATYQGLGWDFTNDWRNQETECYPYNPNQAAPPVILSGAVSGSTKIHGKSYNGGTVYVTVGGKTYTTTCSNNLWDVTTDPLQAGDLVRAYAVTSSLNQSYFMTQYVNYAGSGTEEDPYQIFTADDLARINGEYCYKLMNDIDLTSYINKNSPSEGWQPIGRDGAVMVDFNGNGHTISGLWCNSSKDYTGLFANASSSAIRNLTVQVASGKKVKGNNYTGILIGKNTNGRIINCTVTGDVEGKNYTGGLIGQAVYCVITDCRANGNVKGTVLVGGMAGEAGGQSLTLCLANVNVSSTTGSAFVGGLVGQNSSNILQCSTSGTVSTSGSGSIAGGLIGTTTGNVSESYSSSVVTMSADGVYMGGLIGTNYATVDKCYAVGNLDGAKWAGGLVGYNVGSGAYVKNSFAMNHIVNVKDPTGYAERVIGGKKDGASSPEKSNYALDEMQVSVNGVAQVVYDDIYNGIALTDDVLKNAYTYAVMGWDFEKVWTMDDGYPVLRMEEDVQIPDVNDDPDMPLDVVASTDISKMDNVVYVDDQRIRAGQSATLHLNLKNSTEITAFEFTLSLPDGVTVDKTSRGSYNMKFNADTERTDANYHSLSATDKQQGIYVLCYSNNNDIFLNNEGAVVDIPVTLTEGMKSGDYNIFLRDVILTTPMENDKATQYKYNEIVATLTVPGYTLGDTNADDEINVTDIVYLVNYLQEKSAAGFVEDAADLNEDGEINVTDIVYLVNYLQTGKLPNAPAKVAARKAAPVGKDNVLYMDDVKMEAGDSKTLLLNLKNSAQIAAMEFTMVLPEGVTVDKNKRGAYNLTFNADADRTDASLHSLSGTDKNGGIYVLCYSNSNEVFYGNDGALVNIPITVAAGVLDGTYDIFLRNVILTGPVVDGVAAEFKYDEIVIKLVIGNGSISEYILADGTSYEANSTSTVSKLTYTRNFKNTNWQPLYVPFSMEYSDWASQGLEVARLNGFYEYDDNKDGTIDRSALEILIATDNDGYLKPNHPYMVRADKAEVKTITLTNATLHPAKENSGDCSTFETKYIFQGIYNQITKEGLSAMDAYVMSGGSLKQSSSALSPMRWYMTRESRGGQMLPKLSEIKVFVHGEDDATTLDFVNADSEEGTAYNLMGQKVRTSQKGILIRNGKKLVNK